MTLPQPISLAPTNESKLASYCYYPVRKHHTPVQTLLTKSFSLVIITHLDDPYGLRLGLVDILTRVGVGGIVYRVLGFRLFGTKQTLLMLVRVGSVRNLVTIYHSKSYVEPRKEGREEPVYVSWLAI
jgi:hypothetical protein